MLPAWLGYAVFAGGFIVAIGAIVVTVMPALPRIHAALCGRSPMETPAQRWRRVHAAADRARAFGRSAR